MHNVDLAIFERRNDDKPRIYGKPKIRHFLRIQILERGSSYVWRMVERLIKKVLTKIPSGKSPFGGPRQIRFYTAKRDLTRINASPEIKNSVEQRTMGGK